MRRLLVLILLWMPSAFGKIQAQDREYFVAFCSHGVNANSLGGHAFVAIGHGDPFTCNVDGTETEVFGLYARDPDQSGCVPSSFNAAASFFVGPLPGCLFNDARTQLNNLLIIRCDVGRYFQILSTISSWMKKNYELSAQDCLTFVQAIAQNFDFLKIPQRELFLNYPNQFVLEMIKQNGNNFVDKK